MTNTCQRVFLMFYLDTCGLGEIYDEINYQTCNQEPLCPDWTHGSFDCVAVAVKNDYQFKDS